MAWTVIIACPGAQSQGSSSSDLSGQPLKSQAISTGAGPGAVQLLCGTCKERQAISVSARHSRENIYIYCTKLQSWGNTGSRKEKANALPAL